MSALRTDGRRSLASRLEFLLWSGLSSRERALLWGVLLIKLAVSPFFGSHYSNDLFIPFVTYFVKSGFANPWEHFHLAVPDAVPYSGAMLVVLALPFWLASPFVSLTEGSISGISLLLMRIPLLAADIAVFAVLASWFPTRVKRVLFLYWCSPIVFYINYIHGQLDSIPTAFLVLALAATLRQDFFWGGCLYGLGLGSKFHVLAAAPFILLYLLKRPERIGSATRSVCSFLGGMAIPLLVFVLPLALNDSFRAMVFGEGESRAMFAYFLNVTPEIRFYVCPAFILTLFVKFFTFSKTNRDAFILYCGLVFAALVLLLPPGPGWYFWSVPFIVYFYLRQTETSPASYWILSGAYIAYFSARDLLGRHQLTGDYQFPFSLGFTVLQSSPGVCRRVDLPGRRPKQCRLQTHSSAPSHWDRGRFLHGKAHTRYFA